MIYSWALLSLRCQETFESTACGRESDSPTARLAQSESFHCSPNSASFLDKPSLCFFLFRVGNTVVVCDLTIECRTR